MVSPDMMAHSNAPLNCSPCMIKKPKIGLVGSGNIGAMVGMLASMKKLGDVAFFDVMEGIAEGKSLDLSHLAAVEGLATDFKGLCNDYSVLEGSDVVIVTAGFPGMSKDDLLLKNAEVIKMVAAGIKKHCSNAFVICITNPLDAMVQLLQKESGLPPAKAVGMAGVLDSACFSSFLAEKLKVSVDDIHALVMGGHGDTMVAMPQYTTVSGIPVTDLIKMGWMTKKELDAIIAKTKSGGAEIVKHLKTGSAVFAPAAAAVKMAEAYLHDKKSLLPCAALLNGEYGVKGFYVGVPTIIGKNGVEKIVELQLTEEEKTAFSHSVESVKVSMSALDKMSKC